MNGLTRNPDRGTDYFRNFQVFSQLFYSIGHKQGPAPRGAKQALVCVIRPHKGTVRDLINLKTKLRTDRTMQTGRDYLGVLRRDSNSEIDDYLFRDPHFTFVEALPWTQKRNPCVYRGRLITVTRRDDGSLRLNFKPLRLNDGFTVDGYALEVAGEIREALKGLVGE